MYAKRFHPDRFKDLRTNRGLKVDGKKIQFELNQLLL